MRTLDRRTVLEALGATTSLALVGATAAVGDDGDDEAAALEEWFEDTEGYEETVDETDTDEVEITVGAGDDGTQFDPASVRITDGTTVVWEWTGDGGSHDVTHDPTSESEIFEDDDDDPDEDDIEFESDLVEDEGHTFEHEFEEGGQTYLYVCTAHEVDGMYGAVVVDEEETDADDDENNTDD